MCSHYWPAAGEKKQCGKYLTVELVEERPYVDYVHRDFKITFTDDVVSSANTAGQQLQFILLQQTRYHTHHLQFAFSELCTIEVHTNTHSLPHAFTLPSLMLTHTLPSLMLTHTPLPHAHTHTPLPHTPYSCMPASPGTSVSSTSLPGRSEERLRLVPA